MVLFPDPEEQKKGSLRRGDAGAKPLVVLLWEQEDFRRDGEEAIHMRCASLGEYEAKYWRLIDIWDQIRNASVIDRNEGQDCQAEVAKEIAAFAQDLMRELIRAEDVLGLD